MIVESTSKSTLIDQKKFNDVPIDPKPDVLSMTASRIDMVKENFINKVAIRTSQPKAHWRNTDIDARTPKEEIHEEEPSWQIGGS